MDVRRNHRELMTDSKRTRDSAMRFCALLWSSEGKGERRGAYLALFLQQDLIILAQSGAEDNRGDALKTVYPFPAFGSLATDIEHVYSVNGRVRRGKREGQETNERVPILNRVSMMPMLFCLARRTSISVGRYPGVPMRITSPKKLDERRLEKEIYGWKRTY